MRQVKLFLVSAVMSFQSLSCQAEILTPNHSHDGKLICRELCDSLSVFAQPAQDHISHCSNSAVLIRLIKWQAWN